MNKNFEAEAIVAVLERTIRRLWILCIITLLLLVGTNIGWIYYESQFEEVYTETETRDIDQDIDTGDGDANITGIGDINYGKSETEDPEDSDED